jgi:hypothetical protein
MKVYAQEPRQAKQEASLHPGPLTLQAISDHEVPTVPRTNAEGLEGRAGTSATTRFGHDFSRITVYPDSQVRLQAKLTVNTPGDTYEQEADRVAEQVTSMPEPQVQRTCACGGGCPNCQNKQAALEHLQTKSVQANSSGAISAPPIVNEVLHSDGQPLESTTHDFMRSRFGHDFGRVRVHTDARAAESASAVNALAYTVGRDIVFAAGRLAPHTSEGRKLLAHELTHVLQNDQSAVRRQEEIGSNLFGSPFPFPFFEEGESMVPDLSNRGVGTVNNETQNPFDACGSSEDKLPTKLKPGKWGKDKPAPGPHAEGVNDIDFVFPSSEFPINGKTDGMFKIGSNDATISPDPKNKKNSKIDDYTGYHKEDPKHNKKTCQGF